MLTLRAAAELLAGAATLDDLAPLAAAAGCGGVPAPLDDDTRRGLALGADVLEARIATGPGALRALLVTTRGALPMRELLPRLAARLTSRAPHALWLVLASETAGSAVGIAAWRGDRRPPRAAALVADRLRIVDSDAESLRALAATPASIDVLTHERWVDVLGREALTRRFYRALERLVVRLAASASGGDGAQRAELALLYASRLLFLAFLEAKGWLDGDHDFLSHRFDACMAAGGGYHRRVLLPLFFGTLNTPLRARAPAARALGRVPFLNGGLFARTAAERTARGFTFSDEALGALFSDLFAHFRFTAGEETATWAEAAIDPEMLGRAFECLMVARERRASGAFFTPHELVERVTSAGLERAVAATHGDDLARRLLRGDALAPAERARLRNRVAELTVLDPACGSGAFLVHALERLAGLLRALGDDRPPSVVRRALLTHSIFGVDLNPMAVWLCELRLWLSVVIDADETDPMAVPPLPNLDRNVRVGDSLGGAAFDDPGDMRGGMRLRVLRERYARAAGARKESRRRELDRAERRLALDALDTAAAAITAARRELVVAGRGRDLFGEHPPASAELRRRRLELRARATALRAEHRRLASGGALPFSFGIHFADAVSRGGFDLVVGNPPWVRLHRIARADRERLRRRFRVFRGAAWEAGAAYAHAGRGFAAQVDLAALFIEQSVRLARPGGTIALLVPVKLWRSLAGGGVRQLLAADADVRVLEDYSGAPSAFDAVVYPSLLVADRRRPEGGDGRIAPVPCVAASARRGAPSIVWRIPASALALDDTPGSPWLVVPAEVRAAFDRLRAAGIPLAESVVGRPRLGVKCGCNEAFIVQCVDQRRGIAQVVSADGRRGGVEVELLRPVVRGESVRAWRRRPLGEHIVWTHDSRGAPLHRLPPLAAAWLGRWAGVLARRADARHGSRWWSLFRTEGARNDRPRVVWADVGRVPRAMILAAGDPAVPLNSCYCARCRDDADAVALATLLNAPLAAAWLDVLAEPARGGYRRYLGWTTSLFPLPRDWDRARAALAPIGERGLRDAGAVDATELLSASLDAYGLSHRDVAPLLAWCAQ